jgi:hypothetical protein
MQFLRSKVEVAPESGFDQEEPDDGEDDEEEPEGTDGGYEYDAPTEK